MEFSKDYILENEVVQLRPLIEADFEHLLPFSMNEPSLWQYSLLSAGGAENLKKYMQVALNGRAEAHQYPFIVFDKRRSVYAGSTRFYDFQQRHNTTQLGYTWYGQDFQRTGLNRNCKLLMLTFAFEELGLDRVEFRADNTNVRSIAAMKAIGCVQEGVLRSNCKSIEGRRDSIVLSILKDEWFAGGKKRLQGKIV